uniref:Snake venom metalloprotease inhibitor 02A10 n=1 Tax=Zeugodacus cucurbitae TaxID=28588 RepID=A0A0A1XPS1_ZEUCU
MKFFVAVSFALLAFAAADVSHLGGGGGYNYPAPIHEEVRSEPIVPQNTYIPPAPVQEAVLSEPIAPQNTYIPPPAQPQNTYIPPAPVQEAVLSQPIAQPQNTYLPPSSSHGQDGYRYKTVRRVVYRRRF